MAFKLFQVLLIIIFCIMQRLTLYLAIFILLISSIQAQNVIAIQNGSDPNFYTNLDSAIVHANNGDTIYIPGGTFTVNAIIDKSIHIIGIGHNPDSSQATRVTTLNGGVGYISFTSNASNGAIIGIKLGSPMHFNGVNDYLIQYCNTSNVSFISAYSENFTFINNVIGWISVNGRNCVFLNNIFPNGVAQETCSNSIFKNNIFLSNDYCQYALNVPLYSLNSIVENNVFLDSNSYCTWANLCTNSIFNNNLFVEDWLIPEVCYGSGNITNQTQSSIFVYQIGNYFSYDHDYHMQLNCSGKNAGTDGTDIGIFGGPFPWKEGSIPPNPHIQYKTIAGSTDQNGNLNVNIKVSAQDH